MIQDHKIVFDAEPYGDLIPEKLECVGHVQKMTWHKTA